MKKTLKTIAILVAVLALLMLSGCHPDGPRTKSTREKAVDACIEIGGVPIIDGWGDVTDCIFAPGKVKP